MVHDVNSPQNSPAQGDRLQHFEAVGARIRQINKKPLEESGVSPFFQCLLHHILQFVLEQMVFILA